VWDPDGVTAILLLATALGVLVLAAGALVLLARGRRRHAALTATAILVVVVLYLLALVGVSLGTPDRTLAAGEWKCFDDWCVTLVSAPRAGDSVTVQLAVQNRGRRQQTPDSPHVWLVHDGHRDEVTVAGLARPVAAGTTVALPALTLTAPASGRPELVATEGGWPSVVVIGDENSPFHPQPGWDLG